MTSKGLMWSGPGFRNPTRYVTNIGHKNPVHFWRLWERTHKVKPSAVEHSSVLNVSQSIDFLFFSEVDP